ncbi:hypothetical protein J7M23_06810, partial [Candidatus Sumerlaeota bacterium]|nr:hypothetical protein [Candidatus Sumerlaeota bacterium]
IVYQYRVLKRLQRSPVWEDYLVEHLFLGSRQRLRIITAKLTSLPECSQIVTRNIRDFANLWHPYLLHIFLSGKFESEIFYTFQNFEGDSLEERFTAEKIKSPREFYELHSKLLDLIIYLHRENVCCRDLQLKDFALVNGEPLLINLNIFHETTKHLRSPEFTHIIEFIKNNGGVYIEKESLKLKDTLNAFARMMYQTIGWGTLEDALRIKQREQAVYLKKKEKHYVPLVPGIDPNIENIILRAVAEKTNGGYTSLKELSNDLQNLVLKTETDKTVAPFIERPLDSQVSSEQKTSFDQKEPAELTETPLTKPTDDTPLLDYSQHATSPTPETSIPVTHPGKKRLNLRKFLVPLIIFVCVISILYIGINIVREFWGSGNLPPVAMATTPSNFIPVNTKIVLDGSASYDPNNDRLSYYWDVVKGDAKAVIFVPNRTNNAAKTTAIFTKKGLYTIQLRVFDGTNFSTPVLLIINVY